MTTPKLTELAVAPKPKDFRVEEYCKSVFQMFDEKTRTITLLCENCLTKSVIDRFGTKIKTEIIDEKHFTAELDVSVSPTFFGWVVGFGGGMAIIAPEDVKKRYKDLLQEIISSK